MFYSSGLAPCSHLLAFTDIQFFLLQDGNLTSTSIGTTVALINIYQLRPDHNWFKCNKINHYIVGTVYHLVIYMQSN